MRRNIIAVSGVMGSGKTTLCHKLAKKLGWMCLPEPELAKRYLNDFFKDYNRFAYQTQMAFLCSKAVQIIELLQSNNSVILDRSLYEDVNIFAKCWHDRGNMDDRDYCVYTELANFFLNQIPSPIIVLYCHCSLGEAEKRIVTRNRTDQQDFPPNHLEDIKNRYDKWISSYIESPAFGIDTERFDIRTDRVTTKIYQEIVELVFGRQLSFSGDSLEENSWQENILQPLNHTQVQGLINPEVKQTKKQLIHPWAYLAAPFTSEAVQEQDLDQISFYNIMQHGRIKTGLFRSTLLGIEKKLKQYHIDTLIPHRDVNGWGNKKLTPEHIAENCAAQVKECDLFIGILGESNGSHFEFGIAEGRSKPSVIVLCDEIKTSFIGNGLTNNDSVRLVIRCKTIAEIPSLFKTSTFIEFLKQNNLF